MTKLWVVGIGPGGVDQMTGRAYRILQDCQVIIGYTVYVDLVREEFPDAEFLTTPMTQELERCRLAFQEAQKGKRVAMICSGDAGVYGMAGPMLEVGESFPQVQVEVIPGVTAATSGAALLGAPLIHDFCVISLSDLLTPWETIASRLRAAAQGDFVVCLYNPGSRKRADHLRRACEILLEQKSPETVCGTVSHIGREGEETRVLTLEELKDTPVDMFTTVFVGNTQTRRMGEWMVTPRGYRHV